MSDPKKPRMVRIPGPDYCVIEHCKKFGIKPAEQKKLLSLLGKRAPLHELRSNSPPRPPRYR